ncbi:MAG: N-acetylmuramoyl-L-alanine amidase [archaeon]
MTKLKSWLLAAALILNLNIPSKPAAEERFASLESRVRFKVAFFAGHSDVKEAYGALSAVKISENCYNDAILERIGRYRASPVYGFESMLFYSDKHISLQERPILAEESQANIYVEIHHDSGSLKNIKNKRWRNMEGFSVYFPSEDMEGNPNIFKEESEKLALCIGKEIKQAGFKPSDYYTARSEENGKTIFSADFGVYSARFDVLKNAKMPAVLVECGNIVNPYEEKLMQDPGAQMMISEAIMRGISSYLASYRKHCDDLLMQSLKALSFRRMARLRQ